MSDFVRVPAGTKPQKCSGPHCDALVWWAFDPAKQKARPIDCRVAGGQIPSEATDTSQLSLLGDRVEVREGWGLPHFPNCIDKDFLLNRGREEVSRA
jgi:hypothetical protein